MKLVQYNLFFDIMVFDIEYRVLTRISINANFGKTCCSIFNKYLLLGVYVTIFGCFFSFSNYIVQGGLGFCSAPVAL